MKKEYDFKKAKRGPVVPRDPNKVRITIRLDADIVEHFKKQVHKAGGGNYQTLINDALREHIFEEKESIIDTVREVVRTEIQSGLKAVSQGTFRSSANGKIVSSGGSTKRQSTRRIKKAG